MVWIHGIAERYHDISNPTTPAKIRLLGSRLRLTPDSRVLDVGSGRGGPALVLAKSYACRLTCVELSAEFVAAARQRAAAAHLDGLIEVTEGDAADFVVEPEAFDAAMCLGATFAYGGLDATLERLAGGARPGGHVVVGEPYWNALPLPAGTDPQGFGSFADLLATFERHQLPVVSVIAASEDDWDDYLTLRFLAVQDWLDANAAHLEVAAIRAEHERAKVQYARERGRIGWAIVVGRKRPSAP